MELMTAGESHGKALVAVIEGLPAGLPVQKEEIDRYLALRQGGYGRGARQKIEKDTVNILAGVRGGRTLGSPVCLSVENKDYANWEAYMDPCTADLSARRVTCLRPGHADLTGVKKFAQTDARNILERASARETAVRVAAGTVARGLLRELGVEVSGYVRSVAGVTDDKAYPFEALQGVKESPLFMPDAALCAEAMARLDAIREEKDTAGGVVEVRVHGLKSGFGSCMTYGQKLDAALAGALMSIQAIKGVEVGMGFAAALSRGSRVHDAIYYDEAHGFYRNTNNAGGIEGGMSNGEELVLRAAMKPIPTLMRGLDTVDLDTLQPARAATERSDVCAVCACEIIAESVVCFVLAQKVLERLGADTMQDVKERYAKLP